MLGNGITAHVMEWIARRISLVTKDMKISDRQKETIWMLRGKVVLDKMLNRQKSVVLL